MFSQEYSNNLVANHLHGSMSLLLYSADLLGPMATSSPYGLPTKSSLERCTKIANQIIVYHFPPPGDAKKPTYFSSSKFAKFQLSQAFAKFVVVCSTW